jgi:hypothetical protein
MRILAESRTWVGHRQAADSHTSVESSVFFGEIEQNHPDLLSFESSDDKRQLVNGWLMDSGLIKG